MTPLGRIFLFLVCVLNVESVNTQQPHIKILHLGDSYSAGNGARDSKGHRNYYGPEKCYRSPTNWGAQYADSLRADYNVTYSNHACSFSYIRHIMKPKLTHIAPRQCPEQSTWLSDEYYVQKKPLLCAHYVVPQINFVDNTTDMVLMTMGGNDLLFAPIVLNCFLASSATLCNETISLSYAKMPKSLKAAQKNLAEIWNRMGKKGKIVLSQYPHVIEDKRMILEDALVTIDAPRAVRALLVVGNAKISGLCDQFNRDNCAGGDCCVAFNKTVDVFAGHEPNPFLFQANPKGYFREFLNAPVVDEVFHPNQKGYNHWAAAMALEGTFNLSL